MIRILNIRKHLILFKFIILFVISLILLYLLLTYLKFQFTTTYFIISLIPSIIFYIRDHIAKKNAKLILLDFFIEGECYWTTQRLIKFKLYNSGGSTAVIRKIWLEIIDSNPIDKFMLWKVGARFIEIEYNVELNPSEQIKVIDDDSPLKYNPEELDKFKISFYSEKNCLYSLKINIDWYDANNPEDINTISSQVFNLSFPISHPAKARRLIEHNMKSDKKINISKKCRKIYEEELLNIKSLEQFEKSIPLDAFHYNYNLGVFHANLGMNPEALDNFRKSEKNFDPTKAPELITDENTKLFLNIYMQFYSKAIKRIYRECKD